MTPEQTGADDSPGRPMTRDDRPPRDDEAQHLLLRASTPDDLDALMRIARASAIGITTLPADRGRLADKLARSAQAFASLDDASGEETYLFVLEDQRNGQVVGTSGIAASAGFADRFYSYRNEMVVHASAALAASNRIHTLHLCHDLTGDTLLTSFYIDPAYEAGLAPQLLSRARLLFIAEFADRFSDRIAAESPGLADDAGRCPFWDAVGRRFFGMDYPAAEQLAGGRSKAFIAELLPQSPIYVPLLPEEAQWAIGQLHPVAELPFSILLDEGFDADTYVDIFDGGPTVAARLALLKTVASAQGATVIQAQALPIDALPQLPPHGQPPWRMAATTERGQFRALLVAARQAPALQGQLPLSALQQTLLQVRPGDRLCTAPLVWPTTTSRSSQP